MNLKLWRVVERFCRDRVLDAAAFEAFAQLVEEDQESAVRRKVNRWSDEELEQLSFLISGTLDTVVHPQNRSAVLQCQGLYLTGPEASLLALGKREIPSAARQEMVESVSKCLTEGTRLVVGSRIVPATWVHGFGWKQWRAALAREGAMFSRPCQVQPKQASESQGWILPVFVEKDHFTADFEADVSVTGVSGLSVELAGSVARFFGGPDGSLPPDVSVHPILAAAHCCWANAKMIAVHEWAEGLQARAQAAGRSICFEEGPRQGSVRARDAGTRGIVATLEAERSFPVDGTRLAIQLLKGGTAAV